MTIRMKKVKGKIDKARRNEKERETDRQTQREKYRQTKIFLHNQIKQAYFPLE